MKKILFFISIAAFTHTKAQLTSSLTACYALDGSASDPISSLNGTLGAVTATVDRNNNASSAYSFAGSSTSKITLPNDAKIKAKEMSFSAWVKPVASSSAQYIVFAKNQASSNFEAYCLVYNANGKFSVTKGASGNVTNVVSTSTYVSNTWYHLAFTFNDNNLNLYVNGALSVSNTTSLSVDYDPAKGVVLGGSGESFDLPYTGLIDNARFYNRMITATEVSQLYSQDPSCTTATVVTNLSSSLTACYALNNNANDPISGFNGTLSAVTATLDRNNNASSAYSFSGTTSSNILLPNDAKLKAKEMSFSAWVKPTLGNNSQYIVFAKNQASSNFEAYCLVYNANAKFSVTKGASGNVTNAVTTSSYSSNNWYHVAFTFNDNNLNLYVNGALSVSNTTSLSVDYDPAKGVVLGGSGESFNLPYAGLVDNVRFYNRIISGAEVNELYLQDPNCVSSGTTATGIANSGNVSKELSVYPNPTNGELFVQLSENTSGYYAVKTILGNCVINGNISDESSLKLDLSLQATGVYFVEVYSNGHKEVQKIIKQ
ncbi:MAG: T9SS type A sorting domain-containing protein [Bacteroidia bacterium]|nr:T9SS type A sorting domain-containing protein [Bacteroidia bacterium]